MKKKPKVNVNAYIATSLASLTDEATATTPIENLIRAKRPLRFRDAEPVEGFAADSTIYQLYQENAIQKYMKEITTSTVRTRITRYTQPVYSLYKYLM